MHRNAKLIALVGLIACAAPPPHTPPVTQPNPLTQVRWLEGRWTGIQQNGHVFFEGYHFLNDSTIRTYSFADSLSVAPTDSGTIQSRGGTITTGEGSSLWAVDLLTADSVRFAPVRGASNTFVWRRLSADQWVAVLSWPATPDRAARRVEYLMRRGQQESGQPETASGDGRGACTSAAPTRLD
jgi:hypothetical protein